MSGMQGMSKEQHAQTIKARGFCHRSYFTIMFQQLQPASALALPGADGGEMVSVNGLMQDGHACHGKSCQMWDHRKGRCLDRSVAIRLAYGQNEDMAVLANPDFGDRGEGDQAQS